MKIGIIGGGAAGLMAAWLLEQDHEVILFEERDRLGGHVDTVYLPIGDQVVSVEAGFEFFSEPLFPVFCHLLRTLQVDVRPFPLSYTFYDTRNLIQLPPIGPHAFSWKSLSPALFLPLRSLNIFFLEAEAL